MNVGIDKLHYYVPHYYLDMEDLALARGVDVAKYKQGIGQHKMAVLAPHEDIVTMALEAAYPIVQDDLDAIDLILFASESGVDFSKAAGTYVHKMLGIQPHTRVLEVKQACYAASGALQLACDYVRVQPTKKALVLSSDVAWYGFASAGEVTQGAGAVAMVISAQPRLATVHKGSVIVDDLPDFYRPSYQEVPNVDGKLSIRSYQEMLKRVAPATPFPYICFHMPFASMANKANAVLPQPLEQAALDLTKRFGQEIGNIYNGSLYLSLLSVLTYAPEDLSGQTLGMFSYGSGAIGEYFTITLESGYTKHLNPASWQAILDRRERLSFEAYVAFMEAFSDKEHRAEYTPNLDALPSTTRFALKAISAGHRSYQMKV